MTIPRKISPGQLIMRIFQDFAHILINSRTAIVGAIIGLLFFCNSNNLNCIGALPFL